MMSRRTKNIPALNLMVAGHARAGKTDFIATLYETLEIQKLIPDGGLEEVAEEIFPTNITAPTPLACKIECRSQRNRILLQLVDTPGLDIQPGMKNYKEGMIENLAQEYLASLLTYVEAQFAKTLNDEAKVKRIKTPDYQVHCCLYFLSPEQVILNKGLSKADKIVLGGLTDKVNVIPCLGKSDLVTVRELRTIQDYLRQDFNHALIDLYDFGEDENDDGSETYKSLLPFCMINSEEMAHEEGKNREMGIFIENKKVLGREFIWGIIDVQNPDHCGFDALTAILFDTHLEDLRESTRERFYETWRTKNLRNQKTSLYVPVDLKSIMIED